MKCHICQSQSQWFFQTKVLNKYDVNYWQCTHCQFVQTESPYWLDEAYHRAITPSDDGLIFRNLMLAQISKNIINSFFPRAGNFLDFGGGYGLFVRLMRDMRFAFFWQDQFCQNLFADGLEIKDNLQYELITAWEVFEHFINPLEQIEQLLKISSNILLSTETLPANNPQPDQWWYYAPQEGQHISIYTIKSLQIIAKKFGLNFYSNGNSIHLLTKDLIDAQLFQKSSQYNAQKLRQFLWQKQDYLKTFQLLENQDINHQINSQEKQLSENISNLTITKKLYFINQRLGVNIAGFIKSELGIGEGVRSIIRAVETTDIPFLINNIDLPSHRNADTSYQNFSPDNHHPINILQINANEVNTFMKRGVLQKYLNNHYNIGFWAWELPKFPPEWVAALTPFHEIWTYSNYCADAITQVAPIPVLRMMPSINLATPNLTKEDLVLPKDKFIFLFMFDFFSRVQRKNPMAIIRAFKQAFDRDNQDVLLIIKCSNSQKFPAERQILIDLIDNYDSIKLIDGYFSKEQINALVYHCDCYVSLHRCEGFGLTMAEAMFYGKPVIATGYSSNIEFMNVANSFLVKYDLVEIDGNYGPYKKGDIWADAKVDHCSELMQYVVNNYPLAKKIGDQAAKDMKTLFNPEVVGKKIKERLTYIANLTNNFSILPRPSYERFYQEFYPESKQIERVNEFNDQTAQALNIQKNLSPLVSICIPTYNGEKFIAEALDSAIKQTYQPLEIIVSDDNSQDQTVKIFQKFQAKNPQINCRLLQHKNFGLVGNLNFCIEQAHGKYIKFLFQDDLLLPNCIWEMVKLAESDPEIGLVFSPRQVILSPDAENHENCLAAYRGTQNLYKDWANLQTIQAGQTLLSDPHWMQYRLNKIGEPTTVLIPKEVFQKVGKFDSNLQQLLDVDMWFRIMGNYKVGFVKQHLSQLRIHPRQQTQINLATGQNPQDYHRFYQKLLQSPIYSFLTPDLKQKVGQKFSQINAKELTQIKSLISQYQGNSQTELLVKSLRQIRHELANNLLNLIEFQSDNYQNYIDQIIELHRILRNSGIKNEKLTVDEEKFIAEISRNLSAEQVATNLTNQYTINILIFHLYCYAYQLPIKYQNVPIPKWFFPDFLNLLCEHPIIFSSSNDLAKYQGFIEYFINYLIGNIFSNQNAELGGIIAEFITFNLDLSSLIYFTSNSLENLANRLMEVRQLYWEARSNNINHPQLEQVINHIDPVNLSIINQPINCGIVIDSKNLHEKSISALIPIIKSFNAAQYSLKLYICPRDSSSDVENSGKNLLKQQTDISIVELPHSLLEQIAQLRQVKLDLLFIAGNINSVDDQVSHLAIHRLAKKQITNQVFTPVCIDSDQLDYYITGELFTATITEKSRTKVLTMPGSGFAFAPLPMIDSPNNMILNPAMWGADQDTVIFMSCADIEKITPLVRETWVEILAGVNNSILVLSPCSHPTWEYQAHILLREIQLLCTEKNIETNRVFVTKHLGVSANIAKFLKLAHIYLDTFPYTGTQSLWQALAETISVVVLEGAGIQAKQASSLLQELALPELITHNPHDYVKLSQLLALNPQLRQTYSQRIETKFAEIANFAGKFNYVQHLQAIKESITVSNI